MSSNPEYMGMPSTFAVSLTNMRVVQSGVNGNAIYISINGTNFDDSIWHSWKSPQYFDRLGAQNVEKWSR